MGKHIVGLVVAISLATVTSRAAAQSGGGESKDSANSPIVTRMMAFDKNKDGKLTRDEITDERLLRLFDRADANKDGVVTREELMALAAKLDADAPQGRGGPGDRGGPPGGFDGGPGGPGGPGPRGRGGPGGFGGPPQPGQVLPPMLQDMLELTDEQKKQVADLQKDVDARLAKILTDQQMSRLKQMRQRGPRGPGGRGGPDGAAPPPPPPPPDGQ
jgi:hypothetical protein